MMYDYCKRVDSSLELLLRDKTIRAQPAALQGRDCFKIGYEGSDDAAGYTKFHRPPAV